jgi:hypothetical protein
VVGPGEAQRDGVGGRLGRAQPVVPVVEGVGREVHRPGRGGQDPAPADRDPADEQLGRGGEQPPRAAVGPPHRPGHDRAGVVDQLGDRLDQHRVGADLDEHAVPLPEQLGHGRAEADLVAQVPVPVPAVQDTGVGDPLAGHRGAERHQGRLRLDPGQRLGQRVADVFHVPGVRGVVHGHPPDADALPGQAFQCFAEGLGVAGDDHRRRPVDRRHLDPARPRHQPHDGFVLAQRDRRHAAAPGQLRRDRPAAQGNHLRRVFEGQRTRHAGGRDLPLGVPEHRVGHHADRGPHRRQAHHHREARGLEHVDPVHQRGIAVAAEHVHQGPVDPRPERGRALFDPLGEHRGRVEQFAAHAGPLRALPGEHPHDLARRPGRGHPAGHHAGRVLATGQCGQRGPRFPGGLRHDDRALAEHRAPGQRRGHVRRRLAGLLDELRQPAGLPGQGAGAARGEHDRHDAAGRRHLGGRPEFERCLFDDEVRVRPADPERGDPGPARPVAGRPLPRLGQQLDRTGGPVDLGGGPVHVQGARHEAVPQRLHHLEHARDAGGRLGVAEVRLQRPQPQRLFRVPVLAVGGQQGLRLDRVAQCRPGAVALHEVHIGRFQAGVPQRPADHPLLRRAVGRRQAVRGTVLVHRGTAQHGQDAVPALACHRQPLQHDDADAFGPARAVGAVGVGLAAPVPGQPALPRELDEGAGRAHHRHAAGQRHRALALPQRLRRQVHRHQ